MFKDHTLEERPGGQHPRGHREEGSREGGGPEQAHDWGTGPPHGLHPTCELPEGHAPGRLTEAHCPQHTWARGPTGCQLEASSRRQCSERGTRLRWAEATSRRCGGRGEGRAWRTLQTSTPDRPAVRQEPPD